ncbi:MAG: T9SS type A sorting domain-containing protein, partial [Cyclobacteriaceae bacterium]|nr:T9SS type A sorting domain-containing protein [Cyclobacteriaceae bacterium]
MNPGEFRLFTDVELTQPDLILGTDQKAISTITFYPNPATTRVYIADTENNAAFKACFYNLQGQLVLTEQLDPNRSFIDIGHLPGGIYIISIPETNTRLKLLISD